MDTGNSANEAICLCLYLLEHVPEGKFDAIDEELLDRQWGCKG